MMEEEQDKDIVKTMTERLFNISKDVEKISIQNQWNRDGGLQGPETADLQLLVHPEFKYENPALEFVKVACYLLSLKRSIGSDISSLRRNLLKSLQVREFSNQANFQDPVISFSLPNVVCGYCNSCRDMDLLRDPKLAQRKWDCPTCAHTYDKESVEERLVDLVHRRVAAFQTQDVRCQKCGDVQAANLNAICASCSGALAAKETSQAFKSKLMVFLNIAKFHGFAWLEDTVEFALQGATE
jgi:DNA polymerase epsilon subunit 1